jgi:predicted GNAT family N-acyltransferase
MPNLSVRSISARETLELRQEVLRPDHPLLDSNFVGDDLPDAGHFGVYEEGKLLAVGTIVPEICNDPNGDESMSQTGAWRLRGMATAPQSRGLGCGALIVQACVEHATRRGGRVVWCNARTGALDFYLRHGFIKMSGEYIMPGIGPHFLMKRPLISIT